MIEIIVTVFAVCFVLSTSLTAWSYLATRRDTQCPALATINANLRKIDLFWSLERDDFATFAAGAIEADGRKARRAIIWLWLLSFFGLPGFLLLFAITVSMRFLARSRRSTALFASELARAELAVERVRVVVEELSRVR